MGIDRGAVSERLFLSQSGLSITNLEISDYLKDNGHITGVIVEARGGVRQAKYAALFSTSWRSGYCILHKNWPSVPRLYRDLDRLLALIRLDYRYTGEITLKYVDHALDVSGAERAA